ncbi:Phosphatidate cytidylyltransferase [Metarhizium album ARSEF 1941]|uniref:dolichol kinase n=1 Tax=Metarhizium album (strain ARSEF 1941) TaxID=1081103 RepID=A0A0B2X6N5_METAS|nr:Phosphatidate cytidylyltransferase [Metarhizium album ARSEF 1941]KHO01418.1 Phosphatidate cytidylyltransferase [Metarhizium album ARSEF 1941]
MAQNVDAASLASSGLEQHDALRALDRSPHPYHHQSSELPHLSERFTTHTLARDGRDHGAHLTLTRLADFSKESSPATESGTEADDEHFLKGLPAPKSRLHKGLRDYDEPISGLTTPVPSPAALDDDYLGATSHKSRPQLGQPKKRRLGLLRRNRILVQRVTEASIVASLGCMVVTSSHVAPLFRVWRRGFVCDESPYETASSGDDEDDISSFRGLLRVQTLGPNADITSTKQSIGASGVTPPNGASAVVRKWAYAAYVYAALVGIILVGVRIYVEKFALDGHEPIGWALGYMFGNIPWFRFQVVHANVERWICLPATDGAKECHLGWVQHLRHDTFGEANTRLILSAYWFAILVFGLVVVFRLKEMYEVDTRRKVFHFMMVGMFLPAVYVDPTYAGLALSLILAVFLILDLLRASQLPPLSKPIASFLAPYVDGRDFRGPVVISHIFLLIGCAIPLWLALAALSRAGTGCLSGWEVPTRDVSMVSGVICVGLGDAAASLLGRRYGHRKWLWGGGKSLEGSLAFAVVVFAGLAAAEMWLRIGGWPTTDEPVGWHVSVRNAGICATMGSLTEAVLTGGNDNVIVPVILWTCVKSLGS